MQISVLLPFKENFSPNYAGAVSLFINQTSQNSKYKKNITVYGNTKFKKKLNTKYKNIEFKKLFFESNKYNFIKKFIEFDTVQQCDLIEIHNRPLYLNKIITKINCKFIFHFHNDPLSMTGSKLISEREFMFNKCDRIIFCSEWTKSRFLQGFENTYYNSYKLIVIEHSINKVKIDLKKKEKIIIFVGRLNKAKGYDLFGAAAVQILKKYKDWKVKVVGDEPREIIIHKHKNFKVLGFLNHKKVLKIYEKASIAITCSRWEEPFGRTSLEASSRGCAVIITNKGGLKETITDAIILKDLQVKTLKIEIQKLILNKEKRVTLQKKSLKNFYLTHKYISNKIDKYRDEIFMTRVNFFKSKELMSLKILHVTNFNFRFDGRLFYNTGKRINNGFIKLDHSVLEFSDRDIIHDNKKIVDLDGSVYLNSKLIRVCDNFKPDLIILGHADKISKNTIKLIKKKHSNIKFSQWFLDPLSIKGPDFIKNKDRFMHKYDFMDANFVTTSPDALSFLPNKDKCLFIPNPSDAALDNLKIYNNFCPNDVFFAMSHGVHRGVLKKGKSDERNIFLNKLTKKKDIIFDFYGHKTIQPIWADNFLNIISKSKMGLNLSRGEPQKYYSSDRIAQFMGNGLVTLIDERTQYQDFFNNNEVVFYKNINDLTEKIIRIKNDDKLRKKIGYNGRKKYIKYFNSARVASFIINKTLGLKTNETFLWE